ncbi:MAG: alpha/beta fold hydrolase [Tepidiformaceae bacterium]
MLLLHGLLSSRAAWRPLQRELAGEVLTTAPDLLGYGAADRPGGEYCLESVVAHLLPLIERERPTHVVGHSMGGIVALALARELPGRFERIGVVGLPVFRDRRDGLDYLHRRGLLHRAILRTDCLSHYGCAALHRLRHLWAPVSPILFSRQPREVIVGAFNHCRASHAGSLDRIIFAGLVEELAASVTTPVAALHGGRDHSAPPARVSELAARAGWDLTIAPTAGHQVVVERPRLMARWLRERVLAVDGA